MKTSTQLWLASAFALIGVAVSLALVDSNVWTRGMTIGGVLMYGALRHAEGKAEARDE